MSIVDPDVLNHQVEQSFHVLLDILGLVWPQRRYRDRFFVIYVLIQFYRGGCQWYTTYVYHRLNSTTLNAQFLFCLDIPNVF